MFNFIYDRNEFTTVKFRKQRKYINNLVLLSIKIHDAYKVKLKTFKYNTNSNNGGAM